MERRKWYSQIVDENDFRTHLFKILIDLRVAFPPPSSFVVCSLLHSPQVVQYITLAQRKLTGSVDLIGIAQRFHLI